MAVEGAHLIITGRNESNLEKVAEKCHDETWNRPKVVLGEYFIFIHFNSKDLA